MSRRTLDDVFNNDPLGLLNVSPGKGRKQSTESIYVGMYEEIRAFIKAHGHEPDENSLSIAEAQLGTRLKRLRNDADAQKALAPFDVELSILSASQELKNTSQHKHEEVESNVLSLDDILSSELLLDDDPIFNVSDRLVGTKTQSTNDYQARRTPCADFEKFQPLIEAIQRDLNAGARTTTKIEGIADIKEGQAFIVGGLIAYVAEVGEKYEHRKGHHNARTRIVFSNGMESDLLLRSFGAALYKDKAARAITGSTEGPLFGQRESAAPRAERTGIVYVLKSNSQLPQIKSKRDILHKIGVTSGTVKSRTANATKDPTYLLAEVELIAEFTLYGLHPKAVEKLLHAFFDEARAGIEINDRFGQPVKPREWFFVPATVVGEALDLLIRNELADYWYDAHQARIIRHKSST